MSEVDFTVHLYYFSPILFLIFVIFKCWKLRKYSQYIRFTLSLQILLLCIYAPLAINNVWGWIPMFAFVGVAKQIAWGTVNNLFILTDLLLITSLARWVEKFGHRKDR